MSFPSDRFGRRRAVATLVGAAIGAGSWRALAKAPAGIDPEKGVTAPEDLMKEHGVLNRCLLVYEEGIRRIVAGQEVGAEVFRSAADVVKRFVEDYHEKNEETHIFPVFQKAGREVALVSTLLEQHHAGRRVTARILELAKPDQLRARAGRDALVAACRSFIRMYRPHEAREDTVLFPALREILTPAQVLELGDRMEGNEEKALGAKGYEKMRDTVADLEKSLGIFELAQFTPR